MLHTIVSNNPTLPEIEICLRNNSGLIDTLDSKGYPPAILYLEQAGPIVDEILLKLLSDNINYQFPHSKSQNTILHMVAKDNRLAKYIPYLCKLGANPSIPNIFGETPLSIAISQQIEAGYLYILMKNNLDNNHHFVDYDFNGDNIILSLVKYYQSFNDLDLDLIADNFQKDIEQFNFIGKVDNNGQNILHHFILSKFISDAKIDQIWDTIDIDTLTNMANSADIDGKLPIHLAIDKQNSQMFYKLIDITDCNYIYQNSLNIILYQIMYVPNTIFSSKHTIQKISKKMCIGTLTQSTSDGNHIFCYQHICELDILDPIYYAHLSTQHERNVLLLAINQQWNPSLICKLITHASINGEIFCKLLQKGLLNISILNKINIKSSILDTQIYLDGWKTPLDCYLETDIIDIEIVKMLVTDNNKNYYNNDLTPLTSILSRKINHSTELVKLLQTEKNINMPTISGIYPFTLALEIFSDPIFLSALLSVENIETMDVTKSILKSGNLELIEKCLSINKKWPVFVMSGTTVLEMAIQFNLPKNIITTMHLSSCNEVTEILYLEYLQYSSLMKNLDPVLSSIITAVPDIRARKIMAALNVEKLLKILAISKISPSNINFNILIQIVGIILIEDEVLQFQLAKHLMNQ
jgi:hypothetical protein